MTTEERYEIMEDIDNILMLYGIAPGSVDFSNWTDEELDDFNIEDYLANNK